MLHGGLRAIVSESNKILWTSGKGVPGKSGKHVRAHAELGRTLYQDVKIPNGILKNASRRAGRSAAGFSLLEELAGCHLKEELPSAAAPQCINE